VTDIIGADLERVAAQGQVARQLETAHQRVAAHTQRRRLWAIFSAWQDLGELQNSDMEPENAIAAVDNLRVMQRSTSRSLTANKAASLLPPSSWHLTGAPRPQISKPGWWTSLDP